MCSETRKGNRCTFIPMVCFWQVVFFWGPFSPSATSISIRISWQLFSSVLFEFFFIQCNLGYLHSCTAQKSRSSQYITRHHSCPTSYYYNLCFCAYNYSVYGWESVFMKFFRGEKTQGKLCEFLNCDCGQLSESPWPPPGGVSEARVLI